MKRFLKILSLFSLVCLLISSLCGCYVVDMARESKASYNENGDIVWNGAVYKRLPQSDDFCPETDEHAVYVAAEDVPVLLLPTYGDQALMADAEKLFLEHDFYMDERYELTQVYYCREDLFPEIDKRIREGFPVETVCYTYGSYEEALGEYVECQYHLTQDQQADLKKILETVEPQKMGEGWYLDYQWQVSLYSCTEDMLFQRYAMDICISGSTHYLQVADERFNYFYQVPEEYQQTVGQIMEAFVLANDIEDYEATI